MRKRNFVFVISLIIASLISFCTKVDFDDLASSIVDEEAPEIIINSNNPLSWQINSFFIAPKVSAFDNTDGDISDSIIKSGFIDTTIADTNFLFYSVKDAAGNIGYCTLTVYILNSGPTIKLNPSDTVIINTGTIYSEDNFGFDAVSLGDNVPLNGLVKMTYYDDNDSLINKDSLGFNAGLYKILYEVEYSGFKKIAWRYVIVTDNDLTPPIIKILGKNPDTLWTWESFIDSGAIAIDNGKDTVDVIAEDSVQSGIVGEYKVYYSATDSAGNSSDTFRTVFIIEDTTTPEITITPDTIIVELNDSVILPDIIVSDVIDGNLSEKMIISGIVDSSVAGTYELIISVTDTTGNKAQDTLTILVYNPPKIVLLGNNPNNIIVGSPFYIDSGAIVTDNINDTIPGLSGNGSVNTNEVGEYSIIFTYMDSDSNWADTVIRTVYVYDGNDTLPPVITVLDPNPDTIWVGESHVDSGATAIDNKDGNLDSLIIITDNIDSTTPGLYLITYIVSDFSGNSDTATKEIVVIADTEAPIITITGTNPVTIGIGEAIPSISVTATDNKDGILTDSIKQTGTIIDTVPGTYKIAYTVSDEAGNISSDTFTVNIVDDINPVITIITANPITIEHGDSFTDSVIATDNIDGILTDSIKTSGNINSLTLGNQYLYYSVQDAAGNFDYDTLEVIVVDLTSPVLTISGSNPVSISLGASWSNPSATAIDNVDGDISDSILITGTVNVNAEGTNSLIYRVSDLSGNESKDTLVVNVTTQPDTTNPVISISGNNPDTVAHGSNYTEPTVTALDNVDGDISLNIVKTGSINTDNSGIQTVVYSVSDAAGNDTSVTLTVYVIDLDAPIISIPGPNPDTIHFGTTYTEPSVTAFDSVDGDLTGSVSKLGSVNTSSLGLQMIIYSVSDVQGNEVKDTLIIIINDTLNPVISIPGNNPDTVAYGSTYTSPAVTANDNADGDISANINMTGNVNTNSIGNYNIVYDVSDVSGNSIKDTLTVYVVDLTAPVITIAGNNPLSIDEGGTYNQPSVTAIDNVDGDISGNVVVSGDAVNTSNPGTYDVIFTVTDAAGNQSVDTLVVIVSDDNVAPVITISGPNPLSIDSGTTFTEPAVTANDNVDGDITANIVKSGDNVDVNVLGTYELIYTVSDVAGNTTKDTLIVNVVSTSAPDTIIVDVSDNNNTVYNITSETVYKIPSITSVVTLRVYAGSGALDIVEYDQTGTESKTISASGNDAFTAWGGGANGEYLIITPQVNSTVKFWWY